MRKRFKKYGFKKKGRSFKSRGKFKSRKFMRSPRPGKCGYRM